MNKPQATTPSLPITTGRVFVIPSLPLLLYSLSDPYTTLVRGPVSYAAGGM